MRVPDGHFYSPIPDPIDADLALQHVARKKTGEVPGVALDFEAMAEFWEQLLPTMRSSQFPVEKGETRFFHRNGFFGFGDALVYGAILKRFRPKNLIEVGSGFSSALALEVIEASDLPTRVIFIEPYPAVLERVCGGGLPACAELIRDKVQLVAPTTFDCLNSDDILFIDSSHVAKAGSDLCYLLDVLSRLKAGALIHFHDIFYDFEYPRQWIMKDERAWNECYFLKAFLTCNRDYEVLAFNSHFAKYMSKEFHSAPELFKTNPGGSLWLRKLRSSS